MNKMSKKEILTGIELVCLLCAVYIAHSAWTYREGYLAGAVSCACKPWEMVVGNISQVIP